MQVPLLAGLLMIVNIIQWGVLIGVTFIKSATWVESQLAEPPIPRVAFAPLVIWQFLTRVGPLAFLVIIVLTTVSIRRAARGEKMVPELVRLARYRQALLLVITFLITRGAIRPLLPVKAVSSRSTPTGASVNFRLKEAAVALIRSPTNPLWGPTRLEVLDGKLTLAGRFRAKCLS